MRTPLYEELDAVPVWATGALCRDVDPETFFGLDAAHTSAAKVLCGSCPVQEPCLEYALDERIDYGVWGGLDERERTSLRRARQRQQSPPN